VGGGVVLSNTIAIPLGAPQQAGQALPRLRRRGAGTCLAIPWGAHYVEGGVVLCNTVGGSVVSRKGGLPTGRISALLVVQLGKRPSVRSTLQQNRSHHQRRLTGCDHPNCPQRTTRATSIQRYLGCGGGGRGRL